MPPFDERADVAITLTAATAVALVALTFDKPADDAAVVELLNVVESLMHPAKLVALSDPANNADEALSAPLTSTTYPDVMAPVRPTTSVPVTSPPANGR